MQSIVINKGVQLGVVSVVFTLILYMMGGNALSYGGFLIPIVFIVYMVLAVKAFKASNEGVATFGEALLASWLTALIGGLISTIFTYVLYNFIDPDLQVKATEQAMAMVETFAGDQMDEEQYDEMIEKIEGANSFGLTAQITNYITMSIMGFIVALIIAAITKKDKSEWA